MNFPASEKHSLEQFLNKAMKRGSMIERPEELALIKKLQDGVTWIENAKAIDTQGKRYKEKRYVIRTKRARKAGDKLLRAHYRFVFKIASWYATKGIPVSEAFQAGLSGLLDAAVRFDLERRSHLRLLTYATWRIHQCIQRALLKSNASHIVRVPVHVALAMHKARKVVKQVMAQGGTIGDRYEEILEKTRVVLGRHGHFAKDAVDSLFVGGDASLDASYASDDDDAPIYQMFESSLPTPQEEVLTNEREDQLRRALHKLSPVEEAVLKYRLEGLTLEEVGRNIAKRGLTKARTTKVTRERARQIEAVALRKLAVILRKMGVRE